MMVELDHCAGWSTLSPDNGNACVTRTVVFVFRRPRGINSYTLLQLLSTEVVWFSRRFCNFSILPKMHLTSAVFVFLKPSGGLVLSCCVAAAFFSLLPQKHNACCHLSLVDGVANVSFLLFGRFSKPDQSLKFPYLRPTL